MFRRRPVLTALVFGWFVASVVTVVRVTYLDLTRPSRTYRTNSVTLVTPQPRTSAAVWVESTVVGWMVGAVAGCVCVVVLWRPETGAGHGGDDADEDVPVCRG